jgi:hypothetical protein
MKKLNLTALLLGAALFTGLGAVSLSAGDTKCGAGKCGSSMEKPMKKGDGSKCGDAMKKEGKKCGANMKKDSKKCGAEMKEMKEKKKAAAKCGKGKCGGN